MEEGSDYEPLRNGMEIDLCDMGAVRKEGDDEYEGGALYEIDVALLPKEMNLIRVSVVWE